MFPLHFPARRAVHRAGLGLAALWLAGCASLDPDGALQPVQQIAHQQLGAELGQSVQRLDSPASQDQAARRVAELLASPLDADRAVQVALLNNRGWQASLLELGIAQAQLVQASRLPNPGFSIARMKRGDEREIERAFTLDLAHLITLPLTRPLEQRRLAATQRAVAQEMLSLAAETRKAFYAAVAAEQVARYQVDVRANAEAGAELARRMARAGNFNALQQAREQGFFAEATLNASRAQQQRVASRERLVRLLGLAGDPAALQLPERLPDLPAQLREQPSVEQQALDQRLDVQGARLQAEASARNLGLSRVTRFINVLELGVQRNSSNEAPRQTGYELSVEIPLFDWSGARIAQAEAVYMQSVHRAAQVAVEARSEVRQAWQGYRSAWDIARHYRDEILPTAKRVSEQNLLRYNGMFISVFELLADARAQVAAVNGAIEAQRDFWMAQADLEMALIGKPSLGSATAANASANASATAAGNAAAAH